MDIKNFDKYVFSREALEIFKLIWLSCVSDEMVLKECSEFLKMQDATLADTYQIIRIGSATIAWSLFLRKSKKDMIEKRDVLLAFSDWQHADQMREGYIKGKQDFWHKQFDLCEYAFSHILKPILTIKKNPITGSLFWGGRKPVMLSNLFSNNEEMKDKNILLVHFGVIVCKLDWENGSDKETLKLICREQDRLFEEVIPDNIDYLNLKPLYERNFNFYNSLRI